MSAWQKNFTDQFVRTVKFRPGTSSGGKPLTRNEWLDTKVRGLSLRVTENGAKSWSIRYRHKETKKQSRLSLGPYPAVTLSSAREKALSVIAGVAQGADPSAERRAAIAAAQRQQMNTVEGLGNSYFEAAKNGRHRTNAKPKATSTLRLERSNFDRHVVPAIGDMPISEVERSDIRRLVTNLLDTSYLSAATQSLKVLQQIFVFAEFQDLVAASPCRGVSVPSYEHRERVLSDEELRSIWNTAEQIDDMKIGRLFGLAVQFCILSLQRRSEVLQMNLEEINRKEMTWTIPGARTKNRRTHTVPLTDLMLQFIDEAHAISGKPASGVVFASKRGDKPASVDALSRAYLAIARANEITDTRLHDVRRTGATFLTTERVGLSRFTVSQVLNHSSDTGGASKVTGIYDRNTYLSDKRIALEAWGHLLHEIISGAARPTNVVNGPGALGR